MAISRLCLGLLVAFLALSPKLGFGDDVEAALGANTQNWGARHAGTEHNPAVEFGIDGRYRSGRWTPLFIKDPDFLKAYQIQTLDGESVRYIQTFQIEQDRMLDGRYCVLLPAGPPGAPLEVRVTDLSGQVIEKPIFRKRLVEGRVSHDRPWVVALSNPLGLDEIGRNELLSVGGSLDVSIVSVRADLPDHWLGFDGVDLLVLSGASVELLKSLNSAQQEALKQWVLGGGNLLVSLGAFGPEIFESAPWLAEVLHADDGFEVFQAEPEGIETFVSAKAPISAFQATRLNNAGDTTLLAGRNAERQMVPLITLHSVGLGKATVFAGGLSESPFVEWKQYADLIDRMLPDLLPSKRSRRDSGAITADVRYEEIAGQVRVNLDRFVSERGASFSIIAAIVLVLIGLIGPLDYFLVNRWLGRPMLGWLTFPLTIMAFSAAIVVWNRQALPTSANQITVLDIDSETQVGRAFTWAQLYVDGAERIDLQYVLSGPGGAGGQDLLTVPWGYAGSVYGGIEVAGEDIRLPTYQLDTTFKLDQPASSKLIGVPLAPKSSRGIAGRWRFPGNKIPVIDLKRRIGSDLLSGSLINPFDADLLDGYLVYRNLAYIMPTRVPANSRIVSIESLPTKNFRWRLNRRQTVEESSRSEAWNPASDDDLDRLMEIVMFYKAAGGAKYAGLDNRELADLDLSEALAMDKAIIVGRLAQSPADLEVNGELLDSEQVNDLTYIRMIIPIKNQAASRGDVEKR